MKDLKTEIAKMLVQSANRIAEVIPSASFEFWQRKDFRLYVSFQKLDQTEQDRMFNELEVSLLGLFVLQFEHAQQNAPEEKVLVYKSLEKELIESFLALFHKVGIEKKHLDMWEKLIDMRLIEYREHFLIALEQSIEMKEFKKDNRMRYTWARLETLTIDCLSHLRRGKVEEQDPLWKLLRKWFITQDVLLYPITNPPKLK